MLKSEKAQKIEVKHIEVPGKKSTCKYYRNPGEIYDLQHMGPKGLCLDLYAAAYPYALALLYGAEFSWEQDKDAVNAQCPSPNRTIHFEVRRKKLGLEKSIVHPKDKDYIIKKNSEIWITIKSIGETVESYENSCICTQKIGQEFEFNQGDYFDQMCPAAFNSIYPSLKILMAGGKMPWTKKNQISCVLCPDNFPRIEFEIKRK